MLNIRGITELCIHRETILYISPDNLNFSTINFKLKNCSVFDLKLSFSPTYPRVSYILEKYDIFLPARGKEQGKAKGRNKRI